MSVSPPAPQVHRRTPRANAFAECWIGGLRRELLDRILIVNACHLQCVLAIYETHFNKHRPHRALGQAAPLRALPDPTEDDIKVIRRDARRTAPRIRAGRIGRSSSWHPQVGAERTGTPRAAQTRREERAGGLLESRSPPPTLSKKNAPRISAHLQRRQRLLHRVIRKCRILDGRPTRVPITGQA